MDISFEIPEDIEQELRTKTRCQFRIWPPSVARKTELAPGSRVEAAGIAGEAKGRPLFRASNGRSRRLGENTLDSRVVCDLVKRCLKRAGLPLRLSPHSFRVTAITDLLTQGVPLEDIQNLAGHAEPRTTGLYDRRQK